MNQASSLILKKLSLKSMLFFENRHFLRTSLLVSLFLAPLEAWCQTNNTNQLKQKLSFSLSGDERAVLLNELTWAYIEAENDSCIYFARKARSYILVHERVEEQVVAQIQLVEAYRIQNQLGAAYEELQRAQKEFKRLSVSKKHRSKLLLVKGRLASDQSDIATATSCYRKGYDMSGSFPHILRVEFCIGLADIAQQKGSLQNARKYLMRALSQARKQRNSFLEQIVLNNLGMNSARLHLFEQAQRYFGASLQLAQKQQNLKAQSRAYLNIGNLFYYKGDWNVAVSYYTQSAAIKERLNDKAGISMIHNNIAAIYKEQKRYKKSLEYYRKSTDYYQQTADSISLAETWINEAIVHIFLKNHQTGIHLIQKALQLLKMGFIYKIT